jgi:hypothetical protein
LARFRNDTGSVLSSQEFGLIPPGEFDAHGWDPEVHGVIPGCTWLDAPEPESAADIPKAAKRGTAAKDKEAAG